MRLWLAGLLVACSSPSESGPAATGGTGSSAPIGKKQVAFDFCHGPWCWVSGRPQGNELHDVIARGKDVWAVGSWGTVMHHDGTRWHIESIDTARLDAIWVADNGDVWVISKGDGLIARRDAKGWRKFPGLVEPKKKLRAVSGGAADDVWIVGDGGLVLHWDGKDLTRIKAGAWNVLYEVVVIAKDNVWISEMDGILKWNGKQWSSEDIPGLGLSAFMDMKAFSPTDVWGLDDMGVVYHWDGKIWWASSDDGMTKSHDLKDDETPYHSFTSSGLRSHGRFSGTKDDLWVTGDSWMHRFENGHWRNKGSLPKWINASTRIDDQVLGVGDGGMIKRLAPKAKWATERSGLEFSIQRMWSDGTGSLVVAGYGAYLGIHGKLAIVKDGVATPIKYDGPAGGLVGYSASDFFLSGSDGEIRRHDGKTWTKMTTPTKETIRWIALGSPTWAVGDKGTILKLDGAAWVAVPSPVTGNIARVWSASPKLAWAIADDGKGSAILRWNGTAWSVAETLADQRLYALDGVDETHAWITGSNGVLVWDGKTWASDPRWPTDTRSYWLDARTTDDVWVTSYRAVWKWDGKAWTEEKIGIDSASSILVENAAVWLGAEDGALLMRKR